MTKDEFINKLSTETSINENDAYMMFGLLPDDPIEQVVFIDNVVDLADRGLTVDFIFSIYAVGYVSPLAPKTAKRIAEILQGGRV